MIYKLWWTCWLKMYQIDVELLIDWCAQKNAPTPNVLQVINDCRTAIHPFPWAWLGGHIPLTKDRWTRDASNHLYTTCPLETWGPTTSPCVIFRSPDSDQCWATQPSRRSHFAFLRELCQSAMMSLLVRKCIGIVEVNMLIDHRQSEQVTMEVEPRCTQLLS